ncbi:MAG TPA: DUF1697 domain-containing protein [Solirubrobacteraceae bacterium]
MSRYAAFLRGMNVGGHRLTNELLRSHFEDLGFEDVATFRASGNVVFAGRKRPPATVREEIEAGLLDALGYAVPTFIRTAEELRKIAERKPFPARLLNASAGKLQVSLLERRASAKAQRAILALAGEEDKLAFGASELYWLPSAGVLESTLDMKTIERALGAMTMRTKGTIEQLAAKHFAE